MRFVVIFLVVFSLFSSIVLFADSLWNDNSAYIYSNKINFAVDDTIQILIDENSAVDYKSQTKSLKSYSLNIQGGEMSALLNFVPKGNVEENNNSQNKDNLKISDVIQGRITAVGGKFVHIAGTKNLTVNNKTNSVQIDGDASFSDINAKTILSSKLTNTRISITTLIDNKSIIISNNDIETVRLKPDSTTDLTTETRVKDAKKKELLLQYFNKVLNVIF